VTGIVLSRSDVRVEARPQEGARVQSLTDLVSGRELLYQRTPPPGPREDFLTSCAGGWDGMFPNDTPWEAHPDHGRVWSAPFRTLDAGTEHVVLAATIDEPAVEIERRLDLLPMPRRGLRVTTILTAHRETGPFLWACHPMLSVGAGWRVDLAVTSLEVDAEAPGRFDPGPLSGREAERAFTIPPAGEGWSEVIYAGGAREARVGSPDRTMTTRIAWDTGFLPELWLVTVTGQLGLDLCFLFEPCTSRPFRLDEAIALGRAASMQAGDRRRFWCELESLDGPGNAD
jgi:hypothetical protein